ncbi:hypothetical protein Agub_g2773 [Astrephomene gubernaculifera]|uniref:GPI transamidase subunit PIG-U n=1 Tax=Astrephomene gubernaculifera TaxID=47775 RepID=A0AAD3HIJ8_9CHLO|nr:hypothetical protein Agub_g2773 [Astrephomene gubernaculifera]
MLFAIIFGAAARLLVAWSGLGRWLAWRIEVSTAPNSNLELREGLALYRLGVSPYSGSSCRIPPLALWLYGPLADHDILYVLTNTILDILAAVLLYRLASQLLSSARASQAHSPASSPASTPPSGPSSPLPALLAWTYLLNPLSLATATAGTTSSLESLAVVAALYGSATANDSSITNNGTRTTAAAGGTGSSAIVQYHRQGDSSRTAPVVAALLGLAVAVYCSLHNVVLLLPVACLLSYGAEDVAAPLAQLLTNRQTPQPQPQRSQPRQQQQPPSLSATGGSGQEDREECKAEREGNVERADREVRVLEEKEGHGVDQQGPQAAETPAAVPSSQLPSPSPASSPYSRQHLLPWRTLARCTAVLAAWLLLLVLLSDLYLTPFMPWPPLSPPHLSEVAAPASATATAAAVGGGGGGGDSSGGPCLPAAAQALTLLAARRPQWQYWPSTSLLRRLYGSVWAWAWVPPAAAATPNEDAMASMTHGSSLLSSSALATCWIPRVYGSQVSYDDATPNVGQWWYLAMEGFEDTKPYVILLALSLLLAPAAPLAFRLGPRRPLALFLIQLLCISLLKPYPSVADLGLFLSLLPLLVRQQLALPAVQERLLLLPASLLLLAVLGPAMQRMWLSYESANSNFYYSITLCYGAWQVVVLGLLLEGTLRIDRMMRGKEEVVSGST